MERKTIAVARADDLEDGCARVFQAGDLRIAVCRVDGELFAVEDMCTHDYAPLGDGKLDGHAIECPRHGARFDVRNGNVLRMPAAHPVRTFPVREESGEIYVEID